MLLVSCNLDAIEGEKYSESLPHVILLVSHNVKTVTTSKWTIRLDFSHQVT